MTIEDKQGDQNAFKKVKSDFSRKMFSLLGSSSHNSGKIQSTKSPILSKINRIKPRSTIRSHINSLSDDVSKK